MPRLATTRKAISIQMLTAPAQAAVPSAYSSIVSSSVRFRPMRSAMRPNRIPPADQPSSNIDVRMPPHLSVAAFAADDPIGSPSSVGTQLGATKLNRRPSNTSKPQPSQAANSTVHW